MLSLIRRSTTLHLALLTTVVLILAGARAFAGVTVTQNVGPGATSWPATPILSTLSNPSAQATVGESFTGGGGATSYGQTFTIPQGANYKLQTIYLYVGGGTGTTGAATLTLNLYYLGARLAPNPNSYSPGADLFGSGQGLPITYTPQANGLIRLDFTDSDQVVLRAGRMYAFGISGASGTSPVNWLRSTSDTYAGGAAYRNRAWINGNNARDFALAVYGEVTNETPAPSECTVNPGVLRQQIDGFGAGVVFLDAGLDPLTDGQMDTLYGAGPGQFGLSLIRVRISPTGNWSDALGNGRKAHARGAKILATPWTPPAAMKSSNNIVGGSLLPSAYGDYVAYLNSFLDAMTANGSPVSVISLQNEPDITVTYESASWTAAQFQTFCRDYAGAINAPVMMPESFQFNQAVSDPTLNDPAAAANIDYIGGHLYGAGVRDYPLARSLGKRIWMTEYLVNDQTIATAIDTAAQISDCLTTGNMSAYIWWKTIGNANGLLDAAGAPQRRGFVMGQFSRFVRPGDFRIDVSANAGPLSVSAFKDPVTGRFAIVTVNNTTLPETQKFNLGGITTSTVSPWVTSATQSLEQQSPLATSGGAFTYEIPSMSVVTFTGFDAPLITSGGAASATFGEPFRLGVTATNSPTGYSALGLPPGLAIDPASGVISGTPTAAGEYRATVIATNPGGSGALDLTITVLKANASVTLSDLAAFYDGAPRTATATTAPAGLAIILTYNGKPVPPIYPGSYTVVATIDDPNYAGSATGALEIEAAALVRHMTSLNGGIDGSIQILTAENVTLGGNSRITGDLLAPGMPEIRLTGQPTFDGALDGDGSPDPSSHTVTLNGAAALRHVVRRIDPLTLPTVDAPPQPTGARSVTINQPGESAGDFATVRNLTLKSDVGLVSVPPGAYGSFSANSGSGFILGEAGAGPSIYNLQNLTLNGGSRIEVIGPVILVLNRGLSVNSSVTFSDHPAEWLTLKIASGGLTVNGDVSLPATVIAPSGAVTLNGNATLRGVVKADRLIVNGNATLENP
jgi:O-glycosyl hydrolase/cytoskeletal protein CcmA (bactofilin family)